MNKSPRKFYKIFVIMNDMLVDLPAPLNLSLWWNFGSLLGFFLLIQILSGLVLSMHYTSDVLLAFDSVLHISRDVNCGWMVRNVHSNCASLFFMSIYLHIGRGIYYSSYLYSSTWFTGVLILLVTMGTAFLGYVLPWGQMSFWGATVITNLLSAIPYVGGMLVNWIWGGFSVGNATLSRFFSLHFILPFFLLALVIIHLMFLHLSGSGNPIGLNSDLDKIPFHPYFSISDIMGLFFVLLFSFYLIMYFPFIFSDPDNFIPANPMVTPVHIQPEWYFLFAYAILRSVPNKLGGVLSLFFSILILLILPFSMNMKFKGVEFYPLSQFNFWFFVSVTIILTWAGSQPVEDPYVYTGMVFTLMYFIYFLIDPILVSFWDFIID